jgi:phenylalanyl-tRNA synthetase beta subunit
MKNINRVMTDSYFNETITINMVSAENKDKFNFFNIKNINVSTSLNSDKAFLRTSTIHQMLTSYKHNLSYKNPIYPIYELQKIYDRNLTSF